jgi:transposase
VSNDGWHTDNDEGSVMPSPDPVLTPPQPWLTPALEAELEWLAGEAPANVARHARIILGCARGMSFPAVAAAVGVHPNTARNCVRRFEVHGPHGLLHGGTGKLKNAAFSEAVRDAIARIAMHSPASAGDASAQWSLRRLRAHLYRRGLVQAISVEGLRQLLRGLPLPPAYWRRPVRRLRPLSDAVRHALENLAQGPRRDRRLRAQIVLASDRGLNEAEIAAALHVGRETVRRWLRRFHRAGILALQTLPSRTVYPRPVRQAIVRLATSDPRRYGVNRSTWSLPTLRAALLRQRVVQTISIESLRRVLSDAAVALGNTHEEPQPQRSPAVG